MKYIDEQFLWERLKKREVRLYRKKQKIIGKILTKVEKENWIDEIALSKRGKSFLLELAVRSVASVIPEERIVDMNVSIKHIEELRRVLLEDEKERELEEEKREERG